MPVRIERSPFERAAAEGLTGTPSNSTSNSNTKEKALGRRPDSAGDWAPIFIGALMEGTTIKEASQLAGVDLSMPFKRRASDEVFRAAWREAADIGTELLEQEAARRAYHGTIKPVFHKGEECGHVREYSDTLMIFLLKARRPEKYREGVEDGGRAVTTLNVNIVNVESQPSRDTITPLTMSSVEHTGLLLQGDQGAAVLPLEVEVVPSADGTE